MSELRAEDRVAQALDAARALARDSADAPEWFRDDLADHERTLASDGAPEANPTRTSP